MDLITITPKDIPKIVQVLENQPRDDHNDVEPFCHKIISLLKEDDKTVTIRSLLEELPFKSKSDLSILDFLGRNFVVRARLEFPDDREFVNVLKSFATEKGILDINKVNHWINCLYVVEADNEIDYDYYEPGEFVWDYYKKHHTIEI